MEGFVYVMSNSAMPGLVKVGMTEKMPHLRADEISAHEGLPVKMRLEYYALVSGSPRAVEQHAHGALAEYRVAKEWFRCECQIAILAIKQGAAGRVQHEKFVHAERAEAEREQQKREREAEIRTQAKEKANRERSERAAAIRRLEDDFLRLAPHAEAVLKKHRSYLKIAAQEAFPFVDYSDASRYSKVSCWPEDDILLLAKYNQSDWLLTHAQQRPSRGPARRFLFGDYLVIPAFVIREFELRLQMAGPSFPKYLDATYADIRKLVLSEAS